jgi:glutamate N-acetyltransferase/amino-acid N-acetyltransferase
MFRTVKQFVHRRLLDDATEIHHGNLVAHLRDAELYASAPPKDGVFTAAVDYPPHERCVEIEVEIGDGSAAAIVIGGDLTHEYVSENADYRS